MQNKHNYITSRVFFFCILLLLKSNAYAFPLKGNDDNAANDSNLIYAGEKFNNKAVVRIFTHFNGITGVNGGYCTGTIISTNINTVSLNILTARHCFEKDIRANPASPKEDIEKGLVDIDIQGIGKIEGSKFRYERPPCGDTATLCGDIALIEVKDTLDIWNQVGGKARLSFVPSSISDWVDFQPDYVHRKFDPNNKENQAYIMGYGADTNSVTDVGESELKWGLVELYDTNLAMGDMTILSRPVLQGTAGRSAITMIGDSGGPLAQVISNDNTPTVDSVIMLIGALHGGTGTYGMHSIHTAISDEIGQWLSSFSNSIHVESSPLLKTQRKGYLFSGYADFEKMQGAKIKVCLVDEDIITNDFLKRKTTGTELCKSANAVQLCEAVYDNSGDNGWRCQSKDEIQKEGVYYLVASYDQEVSEGNLDMPTRYFPALKKIKVVNAHDLLHLINPIYNNSASANKYYKNEIEIKGKIVPGIYDNVTLNIQEYKDIPVQKIPINYLTVSQCVDKDGTSIKTTIKPDKLGNWSCVVPGGILPLFESVEDFESKQFLMNVRLRVGNSGEYVVRQTRISPTNISLSPPNIEVSNIEDLGQGQIRFYGLKANNLDELYSGIYANTPFGDIHRYNVKDRGIENSNVFFSSRMNNEDVIKSTRSYFDKKYSNIYRQDTVFITPIVNVPGAGQTTLKNPINTLDHNYKATPASINVNTVFFPPLIMNVTQNNTGLTIDGIGGAKSIEGSVQPYDDTVNYTISGRFASYYIIKGNNFREVKIIPDDKFNGYNDNALASTFSFTRTDSVLDHGKYTVAGLEGFEATTQNAEEPNGATTPDLNFRINRFQDIRDVSAEPGAYMNLSRVVDGPNARRDKITLTLQPLDEDQKSIVLCNNTVIMGGSWDCSNARMPWIAGEYKLGYALRDMNGNELLTDATRLSISKKELGNNPFNQYKDEFVITSPSQDGHYFGANSTAVFYGTFSSGALKGQGTVSGYASVNGLTIPLERIGLGEWKLNLSSVPLSTEVINGKINELVDGKVTNTIEFNYLKIYNILSYNQTSDEFNYNYDSLVGNAPRDLGSILVIAFDNKDGVIKTVPQQINFRQDNTADHSYIAYAHVNSDGSWNLDFSGYTINRRTNIGLYRSTKNGSYELIENTFSSIELPNVYARLNLRNDFNNIKVGEKIELYGLASGGNTVRVTRNDELVCKTDVAYDYFANTNNNWYCLSPDKIWVAGINNLVIEQIDPRSNYTTLEIINVNTKIKGSTPLTVTGHEYPKNQNTWNTIEGTATPGSTLCIYIRQVDMNKTCNDNSRIIVKSDGTWRAPFSLNTIFPGSFPYFVAEFPGNDDGDKGSRNFSALNLVTTSADEQILTIKYPVNGEIYRRSALKWITGLANKGNKICVAKNGIADTICKNPITMDDKGNWFFPFPDDFFMPDNPYNFITVAEYDKSNTLQSSSWVNFQISEDQVESVSVASPQPNAVINQDTDAQNKTSLKGVAKPGSTIKIEPCLEYSNFCDLSVIADADGNWDAGPIPTDIKGDFSFSVSSLEDGEKISVAPIYYSVVDKDEVKLSFKEPFASTVYLLDQKVSAAGTGEVGNTICLTEKPVYKLDECDDTLTIDDGDWTWPLPLKTDSPGEFTLFVSSFDNEVLESQTMTSYFVAQSAN